MANAPPSSARKPATKKPPSRRLNFVALTKRPAGDAEKPTFPPSSVRSRAALQTTPLRSENIRAVDPTRPPMREKSDAKNRRFQKRGFPASPQTRISSKHASAAPPRSDVSRNADFQRRSRPMFSQNTPLRRRARTAFRETPTSGVTSEAHFRPRCLFNAAKTARFRLFAPRSPFQGRFHGENRYVRPRIPEMGRQTPQIGHVPTTSPSLRSASASPTQ